MACTEVCIKEEPAEDEYFRDTTKLQNGFSEANDRTLQAMKRHVSYGCFDDALKERKRKKLDSILMNLNGTYSPVSNQKSNSSDDSLIGAEKIDHLIMKTSEHTVNHSAVNNGICIKEEDQDAYTTKESTTSCLNYSFDTTKKEGLGSTIRSQGSALLGILNGSLNYRSDGRLSGSKVKPSALQKSNKYLSSLLSKPPINTYTTPSVLPDILNQSKDQVSSPAVKQDIQSSLPVGNPQKKHSQMLHSILIAGSQCGSARSQKVSPKLYEAQTRPRSRTVGSKLEGTIQKLLKEKSSVAEPNSLAGDLHSNVTNNLFKQSCMSSLGGDLTDSVEINGKQWVDSLNNMITRHVMSNFENTHMDSSQNQTSNVNRNEGKLCQERKQRKSENITSNSKTPSILKTMISQPVLKQEMPYLPQVEKQEKEYSRSRSNSLLLSLINKPPDISSSTIGIHGNIYHSNMSVNTPQPIGNWTEIQNSNEKMADVESRTDAPKTVILPSDQCQKSAFFTKVKNTELKESKSFSDPDDLQHKDLVLGMLERERSGIGIPFTYQEDNYGLDRSIVYCFKCHICGKTFRHAGTLKVHERAHSFEKEEFKCEICGKVCTAQGYLNIHMRTHAREPVIGRKNHKCSTCGAEFAEAQNLTIHQRMHTGEKLYSCEECGNSFTRKTQLIIHMRIHTGDRPYRCQFCHKTFRQSNGLKLHLTTHTDDKPFRCEICNSGFSRKAHYEKHMRRHRGERPYKCSKCNKSFTDKFNLSMHLKIHQETKDHMCTVCNKGFNQATHLRNHIRFHEGEVGYKCQKCDEIFEHKRSLKFHVEKAHPEADDYLLRLKIRKRKGGDNSINRSNLTQNGETGALVLSAGEEKDMSIASEDDEFDDDEEEDDDVDSNDEELLGKMAFQNYENYKDYDSCDTAVDDPSSIEDEVSQKGLSSDEDEVSQKGLLSDEDERGMILDMGSSDNFNLTC